MSRIDIKITGFGGQGVIMAGMIIGKAASIYDEQFATMIQSFGPEARGSACSAQVILDREPIAYPYVKAPKILVTMNQDAFKLFAAHLPEDGILIYEEDIVEPKGVSLPPERMFGVPATRIAEEVGRTIVLNVVMVGFFAAVTGALTLESVEKAVRASIPAGTEAMNLDALSRGYEYGQKVLAERGQAVESISV
ncbi:MAG: pyruvate ferredoxin oxidoreductase, partial [candidate division Zixibacteria bacterium]|nr:pyruvate ferredoxin oxidoreductase [candidate division Zixibacteria bacterium]